MSSLLAAFAIAALTAAGSALLGQQASQSSETPDWHVVRITDEVIKLRAAGEQARAAELVKDALTRERGAGGQAVLQYWMAALLHDRGDYDRAQTMYRKSLASVRKALGEAHPYAICPIVGLTALYIESARLKLARNTLQAAEKLDFAGYPEMEIHYLTALAALLQAMKHPAEAEQTYRRLLQLLETAQRPAADTVVSVWNNLAASLVAQGRFDEARAALANAERNIRGEAAACARMRIILNRAALEAHSGNRVQGEALVDEAIRRIVTTFGDRHPDLVAAYRLKAELLKQEGQKQQARDFRRHAEELARSLAGGGTVDVAELGRSKTAALPGLASMSR